MTFWSHWAIRFTPRQDFWAHSYISQRIPLIETTYVKAEEEFSLSCLSKGGTTRWLDCNVLSLWLQVATLETFSMLKPLTFHATNWAHTWWQTFWSICRHLHCVCPAGGSRLSRCWEPTRCNLGMGPIARSGELSIKYKYSVTLSSVRSGHNQSYVNKK